MGVCLGKQGWVRGGTKEDARGMARQKELLTQQEREIAHLHAQLEKMQVGSITRLFLLQLVLLFRILCI